MVLGAEVYPKMSRNWSKAVSEGNDPIPQDAHLILDGIILKELRRIMSEAPDKSFDKPTEMVRRANQRLVGLEQKFWQPRLATEADVPTDTKTRKRMEDAAAVQAKYGDSCSAKRVQDGQTSLTSLSLLLSHAGMTSWSTKALWHQSRASHPWRCAR